MRQWIYASLAMLAAAITTWALHATQDTWHPGPIVRHEKQAELEDAAAEVEILEVELARIQKRIDELRENSNR